MESEASQLIAKKGSFSEGDLIISIDPRVFDEQQIYNIEIDLANFSATLLNDEQETIHVVNLQKFIGEDEIVCLKNEYFSWKQENQILKIVVGKYFLNLDLLQYEIPKKNLVRIGERTYQLNKENQKVRYYFPSYRQAYSHSDKVKLVYIQLVFKKNQFKSCEDQIVIIDNGPKIKRNINIIDDPALMYENEINTAPRPQQIRELKQIKENLKKNFPLKLGIKQFSNLAKQLHENKFVSYQEANENGYIYNQQINKLIKMDQEQPIESEVNSKQINMMEAEQALDDLVEKEKELQQKTVYKRSKGTISTNYFKKVRRAPRFALVEGKNKILENNQEYDEDSGCSSGDDGKYFEDMVQKKVKPGINQSNMLVTTMEEKQNKLMQLVQTRKNQKYNNIN